MWQRSDWPTFSIVVAPLLHLLVALQLVSSCTKKEPSNAQPTSLEAKEGNTGSTTVLRASPKFSTAIDSILHDSKGNYWLGSHNEGVALFDGESFRYFSTKDGLPSNQIRSILEGPNGKIWFGTGVGVASWDGEAIVTHTSETEEWKKSDNDLWFNAGNNEGVYRYEDQLGYLALPASKVDDLHHATDFAKGKKNTVWIATYSSVFGYDGNGFTIINNETTGLANETGELHVRSILEDSKGRLWIGNNGVGVLLVDGATTIQFSKEVGLVPLGSQRSGGPSPPGTLEHVFAIEEDRFGNIWFGDRDTGAWKYDGKSMTNYSIEDRLPSPSVWDIYLDKKGELWFGLDNGVVGRINGTSFQALPAHAGAGPSAEATTDG